MWHAEVPLKKDWAIGLVLIAAIITIKLLVSIEDCCTEYYPNYGETVSYSKLLKEHHEDLLIVFILFNAIIFILAFFTRRIWLVILLVLPVECLSCAVFAFAINEGTILSQIDSTTFDGKNFYLAHAGTTTGDMDITIETLILFECAAGKEACHAREIRDYRASYNNVFLKVESDQLHIYADNELIFTLESLDYRIPDE